MTAQLNKYNGAMEYYEKLKAEAGVDSDKFNPDRVKPSTLNKLYVAMTRSRGDLYLMKASTFKAIKDSYITQ